MNYSQRKHLERLAAEAPLGDLDLFGLGGLDLFGLGTFAGLKLVESPDVPRYQLPAEVMPGIPWPPGFRDKMNAAFRELLGTTNVLPRGMAYMLGNSVVVMRPDDVVKISGCL